MGEHINGSSSSALESSKNNTTSAIAHPEEIITYGIEKPALTLGPRRFHYQYSVVLPQVHLILVSVLQSIAFGVLLLGIPLPTNTLWSFVLGYAYQQYFYLPYVISSLLVLVIWKQFVYASLLSIWPLTSIHIFLIYLIAVIEIVAFRVITVASGGTLSSTSLAVWLFWLGWVGVVGGCIRLYNLPFIKKEDFDPEMPNNGAIKAWQIYRKSQIRDGLLYVGLGCGVITLGTIFSQLSNLLKPFLWLILGFLLFILILILLLDFIFRRALFAQLTENSDLYVTSSSVLRYKKTGQGNKKDAVPNVISTAVVERAQTSQNQVKDTPVGHLHYNKFYQYGFFCLLVMIVSGGVALLLNRGGHK